MAKAARCDIGFVVKDFVKPIMQAMTVAVKDYNMRLITTKCLNTAVMFMVLFFGKDALKDTVYCDVNNVVNRHKTHTDNNVTLVRSLSTDLLKRTRLRYVYYLMLTDGYFIRNDGTKAFFPGHVMVWEKIPDASADKVHYYIYQSYINEYDYTGSLEFRESAVILRDKIAYYLRCLTMFAAVPVWTQEMVEFWKDLTNVDTTSMLNARPDNAFFVCYKRRANTMCMKNLHTFATETLASIRTDPLAIYGDPSVFDENEKPLTNREMKVAFTKLVGLLAARIGKNMS